MINYSLKCDKEHSFDSWFASADAFDKLLSTGMIACVHCGSSDVQKAVMAPRVNNKSTSVEDRSASHPSPAEIQAELAKLRQHVEDNSDYVGSNFATEARKMHLGDAPERSIYGEAKLEDAKALIDDGINVMPLPFMTKRKTN